MLDFENLSIFDKIIYNFYRENLSNFKTVLEDTHNNLVLADQCNYNCMSYALGVYDDWLVLNDFEWSRKAGDREIDYEAMTCVFRLCCKEIEERFSVRRLTDPYVELAENERMIAFRLGADDFHFARRNSDGVWTHKPGSSHIREMSKDELLGECWCESNRTFPYESEVAFFAVIEQLLRSLKYGN